MKIKVRKDVKFPARIPAYLYDKMIDEKNKTMKSINLQIVEGIMNKYKRQMDKADRLKIKQNFD